MFGVAGLRYRLLMNEASRWSIPARFVAWSLVWIVGHGLGGAVVGGALGRAGSFAFVSHESMALVLLGVSCVVLGFHQVGWIHLRTPHLARQVQRDWMTRLPWSAVALGYGVQLGCGIMTHVTVASTYAALAFAMLSGSASRGAVIMATFGVARSLAPVLAAPHIASPIDSLRFGVKADAYEPWVLRANVTLLLVVGALLCALYVGAPSIVQLR